MKSRVYARNHYFAMRRLQKPQLHDDEEQEEAAGQAGAEEILPHLPAPHGPQRSEVGSRQKAVGGLAAYCLLPAAYCFSQGRQING